MADDIHAEANARIEFKLDLILDFLGIKPRQPMHFAGYNCPACSNPVDYQIDVVKGVVVRKCQCSTGKLAPLIPLIPVPQQSPQQSPQPTGDVRNDSVNDSPARSVNPDPSRPRR